MSLKKSSLASLGYKSFEDWNSDPNHVYIGRAVSRRVPGIPGSKWGNPFIAEKSNKISLYKCLKRYEDYIRNDPDLFNALIELEGKELGCWCKPYPCHGDILIKLYKERRGQNPDVQETRALISCGSNREVDDDASMIKANLSSHRSRQNIFSMI